MSKLFDKLREGKSPIEDIINEIASNFESPTDNRDFDHYDKPADDKYVDYDPFVGLIENQGNKPRCVFQSAEVHARVQTNRKRLINFENGPQMADFDSQSLYEKAKQEDGYPNIPGTPPRMGPKMVKKYGMEEITPYKGQLFSVKNYWKCKNFNEVINDLVTIGPVMVTVRWYMSFFFGDGLLVPKSNDKYVGLHNIALTRRNEQDESDGVVRGVNSYGMEWGNMGHFIIRKRDWKNLVVESYCMK